VCEDHRVWRLALLALSLGCGRSHFDEIVDATGDSGERDATSADPDVATAACSAGYSGVAGLPSQYRLDTAGPQAWIVAELDCESDGGHLIIPDVQAETDYIISVALAGPYTDIWLGVSDHATEGTYLDVTGAAPPTNWNGAEPNNLTNNEDCVQAFDNGRWNDTQCAFQYHYICECDQIAIAAPRTYCNTETPEHCGDCSTACMSPATCTDQVCI
jgi:hypothetical protein